MRPVPCLWSWHWFEKHGFDLAGNLINFANAHVPLGLLSSSGPPIVFPGSKKAFVDLQLLTSPDATDEQLLKTNLAHHAQVVEHLSWSSVVASAKLLTNVTQRNALRQAIDHRNCLVRLLVVVKEASLSMW